MKHHHIKDTDTIIQFPKPENTRPTKTIARELLKKYLTVAVISTSILTIISAATLYTLFPLQQETPYQIQFLRENNTNINITPPLQINAEAMQAMSRKLSRQYIIDRHEIVRSNKVMRERWGNPGVIYLESTRGIYAHFVTGISQYLQNIRASNATLSVRINTFNIIQDWTPQQHAFYQIEYTLTGRDATDKIVMEKTYTAQMETTFSTIQSIPYALRFYNPWGFVVVSYSEHPN